MIKFKEPELEKQFNNADTKLQKLIKWVHDYCLEKHKVHVTITEVERTREDTVRIYIRQINPKTGKNYTPDEVAVSTHEANPCRAVDIRSSNFTDDECLAIQYHTNSNWIYDPDRLNMKCCKYHGGTAMHFHLQVHPKTVEVN